MKYFIYGGYWNILFINIIEILGLLIFFLNVTQGITHLPTLYIYIGMLLVNDGSIKVFMVIQ
jgi:hypothetical protein